LQLCLVQQPLYVGRFHCTSHSKLIAGPLFVSTAGILQYVRHPMYGGLVLAAVGFAAATGDELRMLLALAFFLVLDTKVSKGAAE